MPTRRTNALAALLASSSLLLASAVRARIARAAGAAGDAREEENGDD